MRSISRVFLSVIVFMVLVTVPAFGSSRPYKDVSESKVGKETCEAITYCKIHHLFDGVIKGNKFHPNKKVTTREFLMMLCNGWDGYVPITKSALANMEKGIVSQYARTELTGLGHNLGVDFFWVGDVNGKLLTRAEVTLMIYDFVRKDPAFAPRY